MMCIASVRCSCDCRKGSEKLQIMARAPQRDVRMSLRYLKGGDKIHVMQGIPSERFMCSRCYLYCHFNIAKLQS